MPNRLKARPRGDKTRVPKPRATKPHSAQPPAPEPEALLHAARCGYLMKTDKGWTHWDCASECQWHATDAEIEELVGAGRLKRDGEGRVALPPATLPKAGRF